MTRGRRRRGGEGPSFRLGLVTGMTLFVLLLVLWKVSAPFRHDFMVLLTAFTGWS